MVLGLKTYLHSIIGLKGGNEKSPGDKQSIKNSGKKDELTISSIDFMGLGFSDKKSGRDLPAGLVPLSDPFPEGELPEVEILVGDTSKFGDALSKATAIKENDADLYKPKVSTWGVFPRPNDISKTVRCFSLLYWIEKLNHILLVVLCIFCDCFRKHYVS